MSPTLDDGDYVLIFKPRTLRVGFIYVVNHDRLGRLIKRLSAIETSGMTLDGDNPASTSSDKIGVVTQDQFIGRAVLAISPKGLKRL